MPALDLTGAEVLWPDGLAEGRLSIAEGLIADGRTGREVDLGDYMILPGIVDAHGDGFERHLAQRRGAMKQLDAGLVACEAEFASNGITTAILAQFISWEGGMRGPEFADRVFSAIRDVNETLVTDLRAQLRFETHMLDQYETLRDRVLEWGIGYVVFNDHLPHDRLAAGKPPRQLQGRALRAGRSPEKHHALMQDLHDRRDAVPAALDALCPGLIAAGIRIGSHDDSTGDSRSVWRARGAGIAEFPETLEAAEAAHQAGDPVIMGAPNVVRGGSHNGNLSAVDAIAMGYCNALASDYHYPSPRRAAFMLADAGVCDLGAAWALVSDGPARVLGLQDRGRIAPGLRADLVILHRASRRVAATFAGGKLSYMCGEIADRFLTS